jgi:hypothetical protein
MSLNCITNLFSCFYNKKHCLRCSAEVLCCFLCVPYSVGDDPLLSSANLTHCSVPVLCTHGGRCCVLESVDQAELHSAEQSMTKWALFWTEERCIPLVIYCYSLMECPPLYNVQTLYQPYCTYAVSHPLKFMAHF